MNNFREKYARFSQILGFVMVFVYASIGLVFLLNHNFYSDFKGTPRIVLGIVLILYAIYRGYRSFYPNRF